jgi:excisionase family DNA binding protein
MEKRDKFLMVNVAADRIGCCDQHIYNLVRSGELVAIRVGVRAMRISEKSLNTFINDRIIDPEEFYA